MLAKTWLGSLTCGDLTHDFFYVSTPGFTAYIIFFPNFKHS